MHTLYCHPESCIHRLNSLSAHTLDTVSGEVAESIQRTSRKHPSTVECLKHCPFCPLSFLVFEMSVLAAPRFGLRARFLRCLKGCLKVYSTVCLATQRSIPRSHPCAFKRMSPISVLERYPSAKSCPEKDRRKRISQHKTICLTKPRLTTCGTHHSSCFPMKKRCTLCRNLEVTCGCACFCPQHMRLSPERKLKYRMFKHGRVIRIKNGCMSTYMSLSSDSFQQLTRSARRTSTSAVVSLERITKTHEH